MVHRSGPIQAPSPPDTAEVLAIGRAAGLVAVGVARAEPFERTRNDLEERRDAGLHGGMAFTYRNPARSSDPSGALPDAASLVVGAWAYDPGAPSTPSAPGVRTAARAARYATHDHYGQLRSALGEIAAHLVAGGWRARVLADDNALVDREAARRAGLGWYGRSANLLVPGHGPWVVLGSVLTDAPLRPATDEAADGCGTCRRCIDACPTGAIVADGVIDARRCLSWRLQDGGVFPAELREPLGDRIYGCDSCLEVCPPGRRPGEASTSQPIPDPRRPGDQAGDTVDVVAMLSATDDELLARHGRWYIAKRDPANLRRNALVVLGNVGDRDDPDVVEAVAAHLADERPVVRSHAVWAARRLGLDSLLAQVDGDEDPWVRAELAAPLPRRTGSVPVELTATHPTGDDT